VSRVKSTPGFQADCGCFPDPNVFGTGLFTTSATPASAAAAGQQTSTSLGGKSGTALTGQYRGVCSPKASCSPLESSRANIYVAVGIVVGVVAGAFLLLFLALICSSKMARRRKKTAPTIP
jgi:hypothetical protein